MKRRQFITLIGGAAVRSVTSPYREPMPLSAVMVLRATDAS
jgi:hypothetical protein